MTDIKDKEDPQSEEHKSVAALADEAKLTEEISKKLHAILRRPGSIARMKAIRVNELGQPISTLPPPPEDEGK